MGQKKTRRTSSERSNRNVRNISNSREVSRRSKGKRKYPYEEDKNQSSGYTESGYNETKVKRKKPRPAVEKQRENDLKKQRRRPAASKSGKKRRRGKRKYVVSRWLGMFLAALQFILSVVLVVNVMFFDMLSTTYIMVMIAILIILLGITLLSQIAAKKRGVIGKVFCIFLCVVMTMGSYYLGQVNTAFQKITGNSQKTSSVAVAVLKDNPAEQLKDVKKEKFGIQYSTHKDQMKSALKTIEKELDSNIHVEEYNDIIDEAQALMDKKVQAMIFKPSQTSIIKEQIPTFEKDIKIIYTHSLVIEIENEVVEQNITEPFAVYLSGIDVEGDISTESRSDVNIIGVVNPTSHQVLLITTPRDYYVPIPGISGGQRDKLTHAGLYGVDVSMATLSNLYDVEIPFYGRVNFTSMINIVDALGGLQVESDMAFDTGWEAGKEFHVQEGINHFDGRETLAFCRERKSLPNGDNDRGRHQQAVLTSMIKKMMSPAMLRGATDIIKSVSDGVDTNFSMEQIQGLVKNQLRNGGAWNIYSMSAEGSSGDGKKICYSSGSTPLYVTIPNQTSVENIKTMIDRVMAGEVIEGSTVAE